jgi:hypothetical protein
MSKSIIVGSYLSSKKCIQSAPIIGFLENLGGSFSDLQKKARIFKRLESLNAVAP